MFDFNSVLEKDEKILYTARPVPGKGGKELGKIALGLVVILLMDIVVAYALIAGDKRSVSLGIIVIILVLLLFNVAIFYTLIYNVFIKKVVTKDDYYCITNKRVLKYEEKKNKLIYGYIINMNAGVRSLKDNYGDLYIEANFLSLKTKQPQEQLIHIKNISIKPNPNNRPFLSFESIENPGAALDVFNNAKMSLPHNEDGLKCPNCYNDFDISMNNCGNCGFDVSFSSSKENVNETVGTMNRVFSTIDNVKLAFIIVGLLVMVSTIAISVYVSTANSFYINGILHIIKLLCILFIVIGISLTTISIIKSKNSKFINAISVLGLALIIFSIIGFGGIKVSDNFKLSSKDYVKVKTIDLGSEKIPTMYSVVGKRKLFISFSDKDLKLDEDNSFDVNYSLVSLVYTNLTSDDVNNYIKALENKNYYYFEKKDDSVIYSKYKYDENKCYAVSIQNNSAITYSTINTTCDSLKYIDESN